MWALLLLLLAQSDLPPSDSGGQQDSVVVGDTVYLTPSLEIYRILERNYRESAAWAKAYLARYIPVQPISLPTGPSSGFRTANPPVAFSRFSLRPCVYFAYADDKDALTGLRSVYQICGDPEGVDVLLYSKTREIRRQDLEYWQRSVAPGTRVMLGIPNYLRFFRIRLMPCLVLRDTTANSAKVLEGYLK